MTSNGTKPYSERPTSNGSAGWRDDPEALVELIRERLGAATQAAIAEHHRAGNPVVIWREGRIVLLHPDGSTTPVETEAAPTRG